MNYEAIYNKLCQRGLTREWMSFTYEKHHIIPKSMGGTNTKSNLAILTPREHAIAHLLLVKFLTGENKAKMVFALKSMIGYRNKNRASLSSKQYERLKRAYQIHSSSPEYRSWRSELTKLQWTPERKASVAEKTKLQWLTGNKREYFSSDEYKTKKSRQMKERWNNPDYVEYHSHKAKNQWKKGKEGWGR